MGVILHRYVIKVKKLGKNLGKIPPIEPPIWSSAYEGMHIVKYISL